MDDSIASYFKSNQKNPIWLYYLKDKKEYIYHTICIFVLFILYYLYEYTIYYYFVPVKLKY